MKHLNAEKIEVLKTKVNLTISLDINNYNVKDAIRELLNMTIENGGSMNVLKQVFDDQGNIKINSKHTFK